MDGVLTPPIDIIALLRQKANHGTPAERQLAAVILNDVGWASRNSISDLAKKAGVSEPTVTRLTVSLGLRGTPDLKLELAQALAISGAYLNGKSEPVLHGDNRPLATVSDYAVKAIRDFQSQVDEALLEEIAGYIAGAKQIQLFGSGGISSATVQEMEFRLFRLRLKVVTQIEGRMQRMTAALADSETVAFGFSMSGGASSVIEALSIARQYGARTIAVAPQDTPLARMAEHLIPYRYVEDGHAYKPNSARFALMALVDSLALKAAESIGPPVLENLRRIKQSLSFSETYDASIPLGD